MSKNLFHRVTHLVALPTKARLLGIFPRDRELLKGGRIQRVNIGPKVRRWALIVETV